MCKKVGIHNEDLEDMTIGMCLDFIDEYIESSTPEDKKVKQASQEDFDAF